MKKVERSDIEDIATYEKTRDEFRTRIFEIKRPRRVHLGEHLTFLFENTMTIRYQVQEMIRAERISGEKEILHEIGTYNGLLGGDGELGCSLLIEIDDAAVRDRRLREWRALPERLYLKLEDSTKVRPRLDEGQRDEERLSSVQYLIFDVKGRVPVAVGSDLPGLEIETALSGEQRAALAEDLAGAAAGSGARAGR